MDFYLDDCADADDLVLRLRQAGHGVRTPRSEAKLGADDADHLAYAAARGWILITKNHRDFRRLHQEWQASGKAHPGILSVCEDNIRSKDMEAPDIVQAIGRLLASGVPIANALHVLNHWR